MTLTFTSMFNESSTCSRPRPRRFPLQRAEQAARGIIDTAWQDLRIASAVAESLARMRRRDQDHTARRQAFKKVLQHVRQDPVLLVMGRIGVHSRPRWTWQQHDNLLRSHVLCSVQPHLRAADRRSGRGQRHLDREAEARMEKVPRPSRHHRARHLPLRDGAWHRYQLFVIDQAVAK